MITEDEMHRLFREAHGGDGRGVAVSRAPGRVNLIGGHTDYNEGFVLPAAVDRYIWVAARPREDTTVNVYAADYGEKSSFKVDSPTFDEEHLWANYVMGVVDVLLKEGYTLGGVDMVVRGDIPQGAGLGSSGALLMATGMIFSEVFHLEIDPVDLAYLGKLAENSFVGVQCGIMDQFVSALGQRDHVLFIDCRTNDYNLIPLDPDFRIVVANTMVRRELSHSAYNERRRQCDEGVRILKRSLPKIKALRDVSPEQFERYKHGLPDVIRKRCSHVVGENSRVLEAAKALKDGKIERLGELMYESHRSLMDDYDVSCRELDALIEAAKEIPGTVGARMTGAGFGGCTVNLVRREQTRNFVHKIKERYNAATSLQAEVYVV
jgi:galactokinase